MFQPTLTNPQTVHKPLSERLLEDWRSSWTAAPPRDQCRHFTPLGEPPGLLLSNFVQGVLTAESRSYQSATFEIITGHTFNTTYSSHFHIGAGDNTTCPHCGDCYTIDHILFDCNHFWYKRVTTIHCNKNYLFSTLSGGKMLVKFLHLTQSLLRPLPACTDPPDRSVVTSLENARWL